MNILRFFKKCITDPPAAVKSVKLVNRIFYGKFYWLIYPGKPLPYRMPTGGKLLLPPDHSFTKMLWPALNFEPEVQAVLHELLKPGDVFIDCGANIGYFSVMAGDIVGRHGRVVSIEANPVTFELLNENLDINNLNRGIHCALTSQPGEVDLLMPEMGDVLSSLKKNSLFDNGNVKSFRVDGLTLDQVLEELSLPKVNLVKIDIEGGEMDVLHSAPNLLEEFRPCFVIEYSPVTWPNFGATPDLLKELLNKYNYNAFLYDESEQKFIEVNDEVWQHYPYTNLIIFPEEKIQKYARSITK